jgi:hypothetical protein
MQVRHKQTNLITWENGGFLLDCPRVHMKIHEASPADLGKLTTGEHKLEIETIKLWAKLPHKPCNSNGLRSNLSLLILAFGLHNFLNFID